MARVVLEHLLDMRPRADIVATGVVTQVVYISKTLLVRGGYTTTDWTTSNPISYPTTLDAQGGGRVQAITAPVVMVSSPYILQISLAFATAARSETPQ